MPITYKTYPIGDRWIQYEPVYATTTPTYDPVYATETAYTNTTASTNWNIDWAVDANGLDIYNTLEPQCRGINYCAIQDAIRAIQAAHVDEQEKLPDQKKLDDLLL